MSTIGVIGPGRAGTALALALTQAGHHVFIHGRRGKELPPPLVLSAGAGAPPWLGEVESVLLAVPDAAITPLAAMLAAGGAIGSSHVVLHLSGLLDATALAPLAPAGAALGSFHPLKPFATDPVAAAASLAGVLATVEGDERAVACGLALARDLGMRGERITAAAKPAYHAGAVFASNYPVTLAATAERLFLEAGLSPEAAHAGLAALMRGAAENVARFGAAALTGPIARGDVETVRRHLEVLSAADAALYRAVGRATLTLATLDETTRAKLTALLEGTGREG